MSPIRKPWWAALALSIPMAMLAAGCGETTETPDTPPPPVVTPKPAKTEAPKVEPAKTEAPKVEPPKVDPPKVDAPKPAAPKAEAPKPEPAKVAAAPVKLSDDELATIRKLPKEDVDAAIKQAVCPVSGDHLGTMDTPVKVTAEGKTFFLCCKSCKKEVDQHPKDVIAKLAK